MEETTWNKFHLQSPENIYVHHYLQGAGAYYVSHTTGSSSSSSSGVFI